MIKLKNLRNFPELSRWTQCDHKGPYKTENNVTREVEGQRQRLEDMLLALRRRVGHEPRNVGDL